MRAYSLALLLLLPFLVFSQPTDPCSVTYSTGNTDFVGFVRTSKASCPSNTLTITVAQGSDVYRTGTASTYAEIGPPATTPPTNPWAGFNLVIKSASSDTVLPTYRSVVALQFGTLKSVTLMNMGFALTTNPHSNKATDSFSIVNCAFEGLFGIKQSPQGLVNTVNVQRSSFKNLEMIGKNKNAVHGYAAVWAEGATVKVKDSVFANIQGRAVKANILSSEGSYYDSNILKVELEDPSRGGALFAVNDITLTGNFFIANKAGYGGAVYSKLGSIASATGNTFIGNVAFGFNANIYGAGGAIYAVKPFNLGGSNHFESNQCKNSHPTNPQIGGAGGAIAIFSATIMGSSVSGSNNTFKSNEAALGGAIFATGSLTSNGAKYQNNKVSGDTGNPPSGLSAFPTNLGGGAIYLMPSSSAFSSTNDLFDGNQANSAISMGGALYATGTVSITSSVFSENKGTAAGQAIYVVGDSNIASTITSGSFSNNLGGSGGNPSIVVTDGKALDLIGSNTFTATNIILNGAGKVKKSGARVTILCDGTGRSPFGSDAQGYTSCMASSTLFTRVLFSTSSDGKDLADLRAKVKMIVGNALADGDLYVDWAVRPTGSRRAVEVHDASATFVLPSLTTNTPSDSYKWANTLQQAPAISTLTTAGYIPTFGANSSNIYAKQSTGTNECAYQDSNACSNNGYCVEPESQGIGYCSCKSGFSQKQCQTEESLRVSQAVAFGSLSWEPELLVTFKSDVEIDVVIISQKNVIQDADNYATSTILRFGGTSNGCNYPKNEKWDLTTKLADGKWYDHYTQKFSYTQLIGCGLARVNTDNTRYLFYNNTLNIERDYVSKQGTKFTFTRKAKTNKPFSLMFPKTVATTSNIRVWNTTIEFFATVSQLNYITEDDKWHMKITTVIANNYQLQSKFVAPSAPADSPTGFSSRNFKIVTDGTGDAKLPPVQCTNEVCQQTFHFVFDACKGFTIANYVFNFDVQCQPSIPPDPSYCVLPTDTNLRVVSFSLDAQTDERGSCPVDKTYDLGTVMKSYDLGLTSTKTLYGSSETAYFGIDFTSPLESSIILNNVCVFKTVPADGTACDDSNKVAFTKLTNPNGHKLAFSASANEMMLVSETVVSGTVIVQAEFTITYGSFTSKRSLITELPHSGSSAINIVMDGVDQPSFLLGENNVEENVNVPSSASLYNVPFVLALLFAFIAF